MIGVVTKENSLNVRGIRVWCVYDCLCFGVDSTSQLRD